MKKGWIFLLVIMMGVGLFASELYDQGYERGYNDAIYGVSYFVSPTMGQPEEWVKGYEEGFAKGLKEKEEEVNAQKKVVSFKNSLNQIVDLYKAVAFQKDEKKMEMLMARSENLFEEMRTNIESEDDVAGLTRGELIEEYVSYVGNLDVQARDAFSYLNRNLIEYLTYRIMVVKEKGSRLELKYYEDLLKKVRFLVGRGV